MKNIRKLMVRIGLGFDLFYFIMNLALPIRDVTRSRLYLGGKYMRRKC